MKSINKIFKDDLRIVEFNKDGKFLYALFDNGTRTRVGKLGQIIIYCCSCQFSKNTTYRSNYKNRQFKCHKCLSSGENNAFFGKKHTEEYKRIKSDMMRGRYDGENNPFFGKKHTSQTKEKFKRRPKLCGTANPFFGKKHTEDTKLKLSKISSQKELERSDEFKKKRSENFILLQQRLMDSDYEKYIQSKKNGGLAAAKSQNNYKPNRLEKKFIDLLNKNNISGFVFAVILGYKQYDFGNKRLRMLIEVHGDYWHGNPLMYGDGEGLKKLNNIQLDKMKKDEEKRAFAEKNNFNLLHFWENDINERPEFVISVLKQKIDEIERGYKTCYPV